jgi:N-acetylated-alpha-linked acidic dipeptidase
MSGVEHTTEQCASIDQARLMAHVAEFAKWTKHAGSQGELASLNYVESELRSLGYAVTRVMHDAYISLPVAASVLVGDDQTVAIAHSFSLGTGKHGLDLELVDVGRGSAADFAAVDVGGKAVLVRGIASPSVTLHAGRHGAAAQIHISPDEHLHEMCVSPIWGSPTDHDLSRLPSTAVVSVSSQAGPGLEQIAEAHGRVTVITEVDTGWRATPIVTAELQPEGTSTAGPFVLFTGHHDTWHYGVMDNGGANATMLEVARVCAQLRASWQRGLRLVFLSGHSQGRYSSSAWYADHHWEELEALAVAHVNIDSTGGAGNTVVANATAAAELAAVAADALSSQAGQAFSGRRMHRAGDQAFWGIGVPSIFGNMGEQPLTDAPDAPPKVGPGTGWWWHTTHDTFDKIDPKLLERDTRIYAHVVSRLLSSRVVPLDYQAAVDSLLGRLEELQSCAEGRLDLSTPVARARHLRDKLSEQQDRIFEPRDDAEAAASNELLRRLSRLIVPVEYTSGDRFGHDPALPTGSIPALDDAPLLAGVGQNDARRHFVETRLTRAATRLGVALRDAERVVDSYLARQH